MTMNLINEDDEIYDDNIIQLPLVIIPKPQAIQSPRSDSSRSSTSTSAITTKPYTPVVKLQFINTAHPSESNTAKRISQIRSHVAKDSHARRRQRKAAKLCTSCTTYSSPSSASPEAILAAAEDAAWTEDSHQAWLSSIRPENTGLDHRGFRRIAPKTRVVVRRANSPGPRQMIGDTKRDAWVGQFAWNLSDDEYGIFNYYLEWVLKYGYEICFPRDQTSSVMKRMKATYVPYAIKHRSLLACILYVAYHRRSVNTADPEEAARCSLKTEHYRLACIEMTRNAISAEEKPALQTISTALLLSSEAYFEGNLDISFTHAKAARTMVSARGGLETFGGTGIDGLISFLLMTSVYSANYFFVPGCALLPTY
ncbi:hypothetical protein ACHAQJ_002620 [Trichoderma viride]